MSTPKIIYGVPFAKSVSAEWQATLERCDIKDLDTGAVYPGSEEGIGANGLASTCRIYTKTRGFQEGAQSYEGVLDACRESLRRLGTKQVDTYYLHSPDPATPITETLKAIQELYLEGAFKNFGLSNFLPGQVQEVYDICSKNNYVLPTVYEGHYNPVGRHAEAELFPLLRKLGVTFNAYGTLAGGFLTKTPEFFTSGTVTHARWNPTTYIGGLYSSLYIRPKILEGLRLWNAIAEEFGISKAALSYRWVAFHSCLRAGEGDGMIVGAMKPGSLEETVRWLKDGPLEEEVVRRIEEVWRVVENEAPIDNFNKQSAHDSTRSAL